MSTASSTIGTLNLARIYADSILAVAQGRWCSLNPLALTYLEEAEDARIFHETIRLIRIQEKRCFTEAMGMKSVMYNPWNALKSTETLKHESESESSMLAHYYMNTANALLRSLPSITTGTMTIMEHGCGVMSGSEIRPTIQRHKVLALRMELLAAYCLTVAELINHPDLYGDLDGDSEVFFIEQEQGMALHLPLYENALRMVHDIREKSMLLDAVLTDGITQFDTAWNEIKSHTLIDDGECTSTGFKAVYPCMKHQAVTASFPYLNEEWKRKIDETMDGPKTPTNQNDEWLAYVKRMHMTHFMQDYVFIKNESGFDPHALNGVNLPAPLGFCTQGIELQHSLETVHFLTTAPVKWVSVHDNATQRVNPTIIPSVIGTEHQTKRYDSIRDLLSGYPSLDVHYEAGHIINILKGDATFMSELLASFINPKPSTNGLDVEKYFMYDSFIDTSEPNKEWMHESPVSCVPVDSIPLDSPLAKNPWTIGTVNDNIRIDSVRAGIHHELREALTDLHNAHQNDGGQGGVRLSLDGLFWMLYEGLASCNTDEGLGNTLLAMSCIAYALGHDGLAYELLLTTGMLDYYPEDDGLYETITGLLGIRDTGYVSIARDNEKKHGDTIINDNPYRYEWRAGFIAPPECIMLEDMRMSMDSCIMDMVFDKVAANRTSMVLDDGCYAQYDILPDYLHRAGMFMGDGGRIMPDGVHSSRPGRDSTIIDPILSSHWKATDHMKDVFSLSFLGNGTSSNGYMRIGRPIPMVPNDNTSLMMDRVRRWSLGLRPVFTHDSEVYVYHVSEELRSPVMDVHPGRYRVLQPNTTGLQAFAVSGTVSHDGRLFRVNDDSIQIHGKANTMSGDGYVTNSDMDAMTTSGLDCKANAPYVSDSSASVDNTVTDTPCNVVVTVHDSSFSTINGHVFGEARLSIVDNVDKN